MTRVAFAADLHVDAYGTKISQASLLNARLVDFLESLAWVIDDALEQDAEVLVVAGDYTERRHAPAWLVAMIRSELTRFRGPAIYLEGNHDGRVGHRSIVELLAQPGDHAVVANPKVIMEQGVRFVCLPYIDRAQARALAPEGLAQADLNRAVSQGIVDLARGLYSSSPATWGSLPSVLVLHQTIGGAWLSESQQAFLGDQDVVVDPVELASAGFDLVIAGHLHRHQVAFNGDASRGFPQIIYPGSIDRVDFAEANDPKGYVLVDFPVRAGRPTWQFRQNPKARAWVTIRTESDEDVLPIDDAIVRARLDAEEGIDVDALRRRLEERAWDVRDLVVEHRREDRREASGLGQVTPFRALEAYIPADHPDRDDLLERGRLMLGGLE